MTITYTITPEDALAFHVYLYRQVPQAKKQYFNQRFGTPLGIVAMAAVLVLYTNAAALALLLFLFGLALLYMLIYPVLHLYSLRYRLNRAGARPPKDVYRLLVHERGLTTHGVDGSTEFFWSAISQVVVTETHLFFFSTPICAIVVPLRAFTNREEQHDLLVCAALSPSSSSIDHILVRLPRRWIPHQQIGAAPSTMDRTSACWCGAIAPVDRASESREASMASIEAAHR